MNLANAKGTSHFLRFFLRAINPYLQYFANYRVLIVHKFPYSKTNHNRNVKIVLFWLLSRNSIQHRIFWYLPESTFMFVLKSCWRIKSEIQLSCFFSLLTFMRKITKYLLNKYAQFSTKMLHIKNDWNLFPALNCFMYNRRHEDKQYKGNKNFKKKQAAPWWGQGPYVFNFYFFGIWHKKFVQYMFIEGTFLWKLCNHTYFILFLLCMLVSSCAWLFLLKS